jgi:LCP family protein required for cell wall assembly
LWALGVLAVLGLAFLVASSVWLFRTVQSLASGPDPEVAEFDPSFQPAPGVQVEAGGGPIDAAAGTPEAAVPAAAPIEAWSGTAPVNILLMGVDLRCDEEGPTHSDTIMLASLDPVAKRASILSLPRDLWVEIPGFGVGRINQAYFDGQAYEYPGGGAQLAAETVEAFIGVPIDYYITVDFQAFVDVVDLLGGIVVDVPESIDDPTYPDNCYGYDPFAIEAGRHRLDGAAALKYARTRATFGGDVDRAGRQQQVILALRDQATQLSTLPQLLLSAPQLWQSLQNNVTTNLDLEQIIQLARLGQDIPPDRIRNVVLDFDYVYNETTPDGQQVLVPVREKIRSLRDELFSPAPVPTPQIEALPELMNTENARVAVYNGTPTFGLAGDTQQYLQGLGINVTTVDNADSSTYTSTQIIDYGSHPYTVQFLIQRMQIPPLNVSTGSNPAGDFDVLVILGSDWQVP